MKTRLLILALILNLSVMAQETDTLLRLSVNDCIDLALQNNITLKNNQLEIEKARATKKEAQTAYLPNVTAQALAFDAMNPMLSFGIEDIDNALVRQTLYNLYAQYGAALGLKKEYSFAQNGMMLNAMAIEPVFAGGRIYHGNQLAKLGIEAAEYQARIQEDEVRLQTES
ncbi:MAG: TolC family protein, partial [Bacteroidales bacterium]|nr:TolC family protein [Bacteroidales bacterium]